MREIKFRAWNSISKGMKTNQQTIELMAEGNPSEYQIMQYTGLKDKNGVEIYEGDIVKFKTMSGWKQRIVEWCNDGMWLPFRDDRYIQDELGDWFDFGEDGTPEVIGNIYENPELLN